MIDYSNLWKTLALAHGQTLELDFGALQLRVHRGLQDWHLAHEAGTALRSKSGMAVARGHRILRARRKQFD